MAIENNRQNTGPRVLDGIRVLDFSAFISGPYCTRMMADVGAEVIKVEPPGGEMLRHAPPLRDGTVSTLFSHLNAGKHCICVDLKRPEAKAAILRLAADVDVVVENFSPGVMARLGLDYASLKAQNPQLIVCSITGFGQTGPDAKRAAFAPIVQAWSGFEHVLLDAQPSLEKPLNMGPPVADTTASLQAFGAISAALFYRERTGFGQYIDIAMYDALISTLHKDFQQVQQPLDSERYYGPVKTKDGWVVMMVLTHRHFTDMCAIIDREDLIDDPDFNTPLSRLNNYARLIALVEAWSRERSSEQVIAAMETTSVPTSVYRDLAASLDDSQLRHRNMITEVIDAAGALTVTNAPFLFSETHAAIRPWVAKVGEHNQAIFADQLGLSDSTIASFF